MKKYFVIVALILVVALFPSFSDAAISRIVAQDATGTGTTSVTATYLSTPTVNDLLIAVLYSSDGGTGGPPTTVPSGWLSVFTTGRSSGDGYIYYKIAGASEPTAVTFADTGSSNMQLGVYEYTGNATTGVLDKNATNSTISSLTCPSGTTTATAQGDELAVVMAQWNVSQSAPSWSNSFSNIASIASNLFVGQKILTVTGTQTSTLTVTGTSAGCVSGIATFKAAPIGPAILTIRGGSFVVQGGQFIVQ